MLLACFLRVLHIPPSLAFQYEGAVGQLTFVEFDYPDNTVDKKKRRKKTNESCTAFLKIAIQVIFTELYYKQIFKKKTYALL